jgi:hypothetical protein
MWPGFMTCRSPIRPKYFFLFTYDRSKVFVLVLQKRIRQPVLTLVNTFHLAVLLGILKLWWWSEQVATAQRLLIKQKVLRWMKRLPSQGTVRIPARLCVADLGQLASHG